jgi:hypothetical protein
MREVHVLAPQSAFAGCVAYRVQGQVMCPVHRSLKNQWTAPALPVANIHRGIGITMCMIGAARAGERMLPTRTDGTAPMAALARVRGWDSLDRDSGQLRLTYR